MISRNTLSHRRIRIAAIRHQPLTVSSATCPAGRCWPSLGGCHREKRLCLRESLLGAGEFSGLHLFAPGREIVAVLLMLCPGGLVDDVAALENTEWSFQLAQLVVLRGLGVRQRIEPRRRHEVRDRDAVDDVGRRFDWVADLEAVGLAMTVVR